MENGYRPVRTGGFFMAMKLRIVDVHAREILDSRGNPTVEAEVTVEKEVGGSQYVGGSAQRRQYRAFRGGGAAGR